MALTIKDLAEIERIVDEKLDEKLDQKFDEKLKNLPTREEFFAIMSELMGELKTSREEQIVLSHQSTDHRERLEALEDIHPRGKHI